MFTKILIANRGEIAVRVMRACRELDIATVAVFSEVDRNALHTRYAQEAHLLGPAPAVDSYLRGDKIIDIALGCGAQAIHPGYGFLAENADFAQQVGDAGLVFIGPRPETIRLLGDKMQARQRAAQAGVPVVPGMEAAIGSAARAKELARKLGYPVLLKAAAGGGGKGMRVVEKASELEGLFRRAQSEARSSFGDDRVYLEKYLQQPRHVEIQIMADASGNFVHLGERECSVQRRHQKVIEESPCPVVDAELRDTMGRAALAAARSAGYLNAGTVEFLLDAHGRFYFLEVNTRLQVEHPVTEMVTGIDLVQEQIRIAAGHPLSFSQPDVQRRGSAIECRIYAEDPDSAFAPSIGTVDSYREPGGPGIRVDSGLTGGDAVSVYYDPLISKLIAWGSTREQAIRRMARALEEYVIGGVRTVIPLHRQVMNHPRFARGDISTHFLSEQMEALCIDGIASQTELENLAILASVHHHQSQKQRETSRHTPRRASNWKTLSRRRNILGV